MKHNDWFEPIFCHQQLSIKDVSSSICVDNLPVLMITNLLAQAKSPVTLAHFYNSI